MKQRKIGIVLILIGIGIPLVLFFFQEEGTIQIGPFSVKELERKLTPTEIKGIERKREEQKLARSTLGQEDEKWESLRENLLKEMYGNDYWKKERWVIRIRKEFIPYKYFIGIGMILFLIGIGMIILSFLPKVEKLNKR